MRIILLAVFSSLFLIAFSNAQNSSVYSRYGIGDLEYGYSPKMMGIGDLGVTQLDPDHLVITNPASWFSLNQTRIEFSLGYKGINISNNTDANFTSETEFKGLTFGFPVSKEYGVGVVAGLVPFTRISYQSKGSYKSPDEAVIPFYNVFYEGKGGISKLFLGSSVFLPFEISAGASLDYYFGNQRYFSKIEFVDNSTNINTTYENNHRSTGFGTTFGLISPNLAAKLNLQTFSDIRLGLSINYISSLNSDTLLTSASSSIIDTIAVSSTKMKIPLRINSGVSFVINDTYHISVDYAYQPWSKFEFNGLKDNNLRDAQKISLAFEFTPKRTSGMKLIEQTVWRGGLSYEETQYKFYGKGINQFSVFGGLSFPIGTDNTIDLGLQYAMRGSKENNLLKEDFIKLYLGISFGELWFLRFDK